MITQIFITIFSCSAIWLVSRKEPWRKWGYVSGLCGQPFWFYTTITHEQWGMFVLCLFYTYSWAQGIYNHFPIKTIPQEPTKTIVKLNGYEISTRSIRRKWQASCNLDDEAFFEGYGDSEQEAINNLEKIMKEYGY